MTSKFGDFELNILYGTFRPTHVNDNGLTEISIIPSPDNTAPSTVLQQGGRGRRKIVFEAQVFEWGKYEELFQDYISARERTFTDEKTGIALNCFIEALSEPTYVNDKIIRFLMELIES